MSNTYAEAETKARSKQPTGGLAGLAIDADAYARHMLQLHGGHGAPTYICGIRCHAGEAPKLPHFMMAC